MSSLVFFSSPSTNIKANCFYGLCYRIKENKFNLQGPGFPSRAENKTKNGKIMLVIKPSIYQL